MTSYHMHIDVRNMLRKSKRDFWRDWKNVFTDDNGKPLTYDQARDALMDELAKGHNFIPFGNCDNFDYVKGRCKGHEDKEKTQ